MTSSPPPSRSGPIDERTTALEGLRRSASTEGGPGGVPMVLALVDHRDGRGRAVPAADERDRRDGARTAAEIARLDHVLLGSGPDPDARTTHLLHAEASLATFDGTDTTVPEVPATPDVRDVPPSTAVLPDAATQRAALAAGSFLRVVNFHLTPETSRDRLRADLAALAQRFSSVTVADLDHFLDTGSWRTPRPPVAPVFYEGYASSASVAAQVCDELSLTGWFAVCTGFVDAPEPVQEVYARAHWIDLHADELDGRRLAMTWDQVRDLGRRHVVFPHTASHAGIADVVTDADLEAEVTEPLRRMTQVTDAAAPLHAWFLGTAYGASRRHDDALRDAGYRYVVSNTMIQRIG